MRRKKKVIACIITVLCLLLLLWVILSKKYVLRQRKKAFRNYPTEKELVLPSGKYYARISLSEDQMERLTTHLKNDEWIETKSIFDEDIRSELVTSEEKQHAIVCYEKVDSIYYTIVPKICIQRVIIFSDGDKIVLQLMITVKGKYSRTED